MLWNHIKISLRNIRRHKLFSAINIVSLTLSITICLAVLMVVKNQFDFDTFHPDSDRTYRIITEATYENDATSRFATVPLPLAENLREYPFLESVLPVYGGSVSLNVTANGKELDGIFAYSEPEFFELFGFRLQQGDPATALSEPNSVVLTPETARRFFGDENPIGRDFDIQGSGVLVVTGVLETNLDRSHLSFDYLISYSTLFQKELTPWGAGATNAWDDLGSGGGRIYVQLKPGESRSQLDGVLPGLSERASQSHELERNVASYSFEAQEIGDIVPGEYLRYEMSGGGTRSLEEILFFSGIALVILLMACFNYTNLSIARALKRSREVGIYKLFGAYRRQIVGQFVTQSTLIAAISLVLAYALLPFVPLPPDIQSEVSGIRPDLEMVGWFALFSLFTGLLAGGLPAWLLSSLKPVTVLKNIKSLNLMKGLTFRKALVTGQFAISIALLITATVIYQQSHWLATTDYGFHRENIINLDLQNSVDPQTMKDELAGIAGVEAISGTSQLFGFHSTPEDFRLEEAGEPIHGDHFWVDRNLVPNMELSLVAGRNFTGEMAGNPGNHAIINEHFLSATRWSAPAEAIGKSVWHRERELQIIGVVENFHYKRMSMPIRPIILHHRPDAIRYLNIRLAGDQPDPFITEMEQAWNAMAPGTEIAYSAYDQQIYEAYSHEEDVASITYYALIALSIACLGLLGMVTYTVEVRTQEVGIRKVLGAGIGNVVTLLSKEFTLLLALAAGIGLPIGYWAGQQFLNTYAYHISIGFFSLFGGFAVMALLGLGAIGWQTWRVARRNPVEAIRTE